MSKRKTMLVAAAAALLLANPVLAETPEREGFTLKLSMGAGASNLRPDVGSAKTYGGLGGLNIELGGFVSRDWAVMFKAGGVNFGPFTDDFSTGVAASAGPSVQYWIYDRVHFELGIGVGVLAASIGERIGPFDAAPSDAQAGFAVMAGAGASILNLKHHSLGVYADFSPIFTADMTGLAVHGGVMWQYF